MLSQVEIPLAKTLYPSPNEFNDFESFVETLDTDDLLQNYGLVKVVPPNKWKAKRNGVESALEEVVVSAPIEQNVQGRTGIYELLLIQKKSMRLSEYRKKVECFDHLTDKKSIEEVEDLFWKNIVFSPPLYGADISGKTLFDTGIPWNLNELPGILRQGLKTQISGVTTTYLYIGSWKSMFGWHKEDMDLYSINYNHYGKPKFWYCMPASEGKKLEDFAKTYFGEGFSKCKEFLRHKTIMIHPYLLKQKIPNLKIYKMVQNPGEFVITGGGAYHAGFNWGLNIAEAVNFATKKWLEMLPNAGACKCISDSVRINKTEFYKNILSDPKYGKVPSIQKICSDNGVTKPREIPEEYERKAESLGTEALRRSQRRSTSTKLVEEQFIGKSVPRMKITSEKSGAKKQSSLLPQSKKIKKMPASIAPTEKLRTRSTHRNVERIEIEEHDDQDNLMAIEENISSKSVNSEDTYSQSVEKDRMFPEESLQQRRMEVE